METRNHNRIAYIDVSSTFEVFKMDRQVNFIRPLGRKCSNPFCPYNDNAYDQFRVEAYNGKCLNCIDDENQASYTDDMFDEDLKAAGF